MNTKKLSKEETNGYLRSVEASLEALRFSLAELWRDGELGSMADERVFQVRIELQNLSMKLSEARAYNKVE